MYKLENVITFRKFNIVNGLFFNVINSDEKVIHREI